MRKNLSTSPTEWLSASPIPLPNPTSILSTFKTGTEQVVQFVGPHRFFRAAGWDSNRKQMASAYGSWWADEKILLEIGRNIQMFEGWLPEKMLKRAWPAQYRGATALCEDWNDMREMFKLELPSGEKIEGLVGLSAAQPQTSNLSRTDRKTPMLLGGVEQVFFKKSQSLSSINPLWVYPEKLW